MSERNNSINISSHVDVGIIVALREEFRELHRELPDSIACKDEATGVSDYVFQRAVHIGQPYSCAANFVGAMGPTEAALATERFINRRKPKTIVMLGIAAGIDDEIRLGDVVITSHVGRYFDRAKIVSGTSSFEIKPGGDSFPCSPDLVRAAQDFEFSHKTRYGQWRDCASEQLAELVDEQPLAKLRSNNWISSKPTFLAGPVASGPVVAAAQEFVEWVKALNRQYLALEMEGGGMLAAVYSRSLPNQTMMLRGISDFGDSRKQQLDKTGKGGIRRYAMRNAIALLWQMMESQILPHSGVEPCAAVGNIDAEHRRTGQLGNKTPSSTIIAFDDAIAAWREKLAFLLEEEAIAGGASQRFRLQKQIEEAKQKISELTEGKAV